MAEPIVMVLTAMLLGQVVMSVPVLLINRATRAYRLPLALFLIACGVLALNAIVPVAFPDRYQAYTVVGFPMLFVLCPALRLYIEGLTAQTHWTLSKATLKQFVLIWPALGVSCLMALLPMQQHQALFVTDEVPGGLYVVILAGSMLVLMCLWLLECGLTLLMITKRLLAFRAALKARYSNLDDPRIFAAKRLVFIAVCIWVLALSSAFLSSLLGHTILTLGSEMLIALILIWSLTFFAMQQTSPLLAPEADCALSKQRAPGTSLSEGSISKYHKSALDESQSARIVNKITHAMQDNQLYLDADLTLQKLSQVSGVSPNYLSQVLNETLQMNFFDFVNHWRIEASKSRLLTSQDSVLHIALEVGFNARSSFYKAFKKETGLTPGEYRLSRQTDRK
ncbi:AraC family transcriptional regulator [Pseudoalteromonas sp. DL2-H2.2]|uniref:helix-turn-helix domain-containing protein n=1 Tax=Pseudoalteromonas sp. DL2-H2.2 TaxID=2908889 RepID=UPI001F3B2744|nr:AraC family transcriptional regulator [Pseudoalteromonas sp. DL2-H2.2]MCF2910520.1 AraC family transcriptional regulator [Pseudoalteromonas sp. DL2-H2.2]